MSRITLTSVGSAVKQGKFFYVPIEYNDKGKDFKKKVMDFTNKEVYQTLKNAKVGEQYDVEIEKDTNGYWQWKTVTKAAAQTSSTSSAGSVPSSTLRSNYETPEERATRQVYIARQSSLGHALKYLEITGRAATAIETDVIDIAEQFVHFVMSSTTDKDTTDGFEENDSE